ncbi:CDP-glycerol glycerophosphotransferase family protein [Actinoplanes sp. NPDC051343]|uniref:bifunctional glycosyltransferase/CDP-glycerol:glycerophosphate glycerophosphotransferase n=1 Tax=Actinoplanes sp. NPDC051343 TaxID=3363906 RepID=UPI0037BDFF87
MTPGLVSVVVPIYNVEPFLRDCLDSLRAQTYRDLEVILVDDGSTDGCAAIAEEFVRADPRFQLIRQENSGLSIARNNGLEHATGEFVAFVDSDDVLAAHAYELLVLALAGGADFASGGVLRLSSRGTHQGEPHKTAVSTTNLKAHVSRDHKLLRDRTIWNKLFRRSFYDRHGFEFPPGRLFEDVPVTVPAHALATKVAIVAEPIYFWRVREGAVLSITQSDHDLRNLVDRFYSVNLTREKLAGSGHHDLLRVYQEQAISDKLSSYLKFLPGASPEFQRTFMELATAYLGELDPGAVDRLPQPAREHWRLIREGRLGDLIELLDTGFRAARTKKRPPLAAHVKSVTWQGDKLQLTGTLSVHGAAPRRLGRARLFWLARTGTRRKLPLWARSDSGSGFTVTIDPAMMRIRKAWRDSTWRIAVATAANLELNRAPVRVPDGWAEVLPRRAVAPGVWVTPYLSKNQLFLGVNRVEAWLIGSHRDGDDLVLEGRLRTAPAGEVKLVLRRAKGLAARTVPVEVTDGPGFRARIPLAEIALGADDDNHAMGLYAQRLPVDLVLGTETVSLVAGDEYLPTRAAAAADEVYTAVSDTGKVSVCTRPLGPVVTEVSWNPRGVLVLRGESGRDVEGELMLRIRGRRRDRTLPLRVTGGRWTVEVDPEAMPGLAGPLPLVEGTWDMAFRSNGRHHSTIAPLGFAGSARAVLPLASTAPDGTVRVLSGAGEERAILFVGPAPVGTTTEPPSTGLTEPVLRDVVLFDGAPGRRVADDPAALLAELTARPDAPAALWTTERGQPVPSGAEPVVLGTDAWRAALLNSRWIVTNDDLPPWFRPRPQQVVLRLTDGWPISRIGTLAVAHPLGRTLVEQLTADAGKWTALASPGHSATPVLRREFRYDGPVLEYGRPADDVLRARQPEDARAEVAARLGLPADTRFVLYAPTRRPMELRKRGSSDPSRLLNLTTTARALPDGYRLLVRRHPTLDQDVLGVVDGSVDVSDYPGVGALLLASDALITDYSSLIADFVTTGKPALLYVPDLAQHSASPGLNVDLQTKAPGPLLRTFDEVAAAVGDLPRIADEYEHAAKAFASDHPTEGTGPAAARLIEWLLTKD